MGLSVQIQTWIDLLIVVNVWNRLGSHAASAITLNTSIKRLNRIVDKKNKWC